MLSKLKPSRANCEDEELSSLIYDEEGQSNKPFLQTIVNQLIRKISVSIMKMLIIHYQW